MSRICESMATLTPAFSANRAVRQYTEEHYIPAASAYAARAAKDGTAAVNLLSWRQRIRERWGDVRFGALKTQSHRGELSLEVEVYLAGLDPSDVRVEVYADSPGSAPFRQEMAQAGQGPANSARHLYSAMISTDRPESDFMDHVDLLQVGAARWQNFDLLKELGKVRRPILLKRGPASTIEELLLSAEYLMMGGNHEVILCERGIRTFETCTRNTLDISAIPVVKQLSHLPIVVDPSHGTGRRDKVAPMARAAVAAGARRPADRSSPRAGNRSLRRRSISPSGSAPRADVAVENDRAGGPAMDHVMAGAFPQAVTVYGTGLIGGSIALALRKHFPGVRVHGIDTPETLEHARRMGIIDNASVAEADESNESDLMVLATPVRHILELIETLPPRQQLILDVGSTKVDICGKAEQRGLPFLGGHPMTGTERSGPEAASADLFRGAPFFLCPIRTTPNGAIARIEALIRTVAAVPVVMPAVSHDRIVAQISHLPQLLSTVLADHTSANLQFAGPGVKSMTRLAGSPFHVWRDIFETSGFLPQELEVFVQRLRSLLDALETGDLAAIQTVFERVNRSSSRGSS